MVAECLEGAFDVSRYFIGAQRQRVSKYLTAPFRLGRLRRALRGSSGHALAVKTFDAAFFNSGCARRNVVIVHHLHDGHLSGESLFYAVYARIEDRILKDLAKSGTTVVVVSEYWNRRLREKGFRNVCKIYNAFRMEEFAFRQEQIQAFMRKYGLLDKPTVYLGNLKSLSGVNCAYEALKDLDVHLIVSSNCPPARTPVRCLSLERQEYLRLLKSAALVVTMSQFAEGWCRTAHEAMLCGTPVLGSGKGGMRELLDAGRQIICEDFKTLRATVNGMLHNEGKRTELGQAGYEYASQFTYERFQDEWTKLVDKLCQPGPNAHLLLREAES
jgi:glycosyltransferase involved in cell wall biosynthesis